MIFILISFNLKDHTYESILIFDFEFKTAYSEKPLSITLNKVDGYISSIIWFRWK